MNIIINSNSMIPIYEQIMESIKKMIIAGQLKQGDLLPSVRALSKDLKISALTVKKAYDSLEAEGLTETVHGKGTFVITTNIAFLEEEQRREVEHSLESVIRKARGYGLGDEEIRQMLELLLED